LAKFGVDGDTDEIQGLFQGHSTQTNDIFVIETSAGTDILAVSLTEINADQTIVASDSITLDGGNFDVTGGGNITLGDSTTPGTDDTIVLGAGADGFIYSDNSNIYITAETATFDLNFMTPSNDGTTEVGFYDSDSARVGGVDSNGNADFDGTLGSGGLATLDSLLVTNQTDLNGDINLGNLATDSISFVGQIDTDLMPIGNDAQDLGGVGESWGGVFATNFINGTDFVADATGVAAADGVMFDVGASTTPTLKKSNAFATGFGWPAGVAKTAAAVGVTVPAQFLGVVSVNVDAGVVAITQGDPAMWTSTAGGGTAGEWSNDTLTITSGDYIVCGGRFISDETGPTIGTALMALYGTPQVTKTP